MTLQVNKKKRVFLVAAPTLNIFNLTVRAYETIKNSDCIILNKKHSHQYQKFIEKLELKIFYEEKIFSKECENKKQMWKQIYKLTEKFDNICHLKMGDPLFFNDGFEEKEFLESKNINVVIINGIVEIVDILNGQKLPLTNRELNSSICFCELNNKSILNFSLNQFQDKKIVFKLNELNSIDILLKMLNNVKNKYFVIDGKIVLCSEKKKIEQLNKNKTYYLVVEKNE